MQGVRILTRKLLPEMSARTKAIDLAKVQETAERLVGERSIADASPGRAAQAEKKASKETLDLLARAAREPNEQNRKELAAAAWDAYEVQLINHYVYLEAKRVREEGETLRGKMQRLAGDANMRRLSEGRGRVRRPSEEPARHHRVRRDRVMAAVDRRTEYLVAANGDMQAAGAMVAWLEKQRALNRDPYVPQAVIDMLGRTVHWKDLRLEQLQDLHDTVASISHVAQTKDRVKTRAGEVEKTKAIEEMAARLRETYGTEQIIVDRNTLAWKKRALRALARAKAGIIRPEELFREMDGGNPEGPFTRLLWRPVSEASDRWSENREPDGEAHPRGGPEAHEGRREALAGHPLHREGPALHPRGGHRRAAQQHERLQPEQAREGVERRVGRQVRDSSAGTPRPGWSS